MAKKENLKKIIDILKSGGIVVSPTDTVYGLLCDSTNKKAVGKIFRIKKREKSKPLALFVKDIAMAKKLAIIDAKKEKFLKKVWPGKITAVLKIKDAAGGGRTPASRRGCDPRKSLLTKKKTIGLRIPNYKLLNLILEKFKKPLAQTSANISGRSATTKIKKVLDYFKNQTTKPDLVVNAADLPARKPSKVIDLINNNILRK